jgi:hypothetical protein
MALSGASRRKQIPSNEKKGNIAHGHENLNIALA